VIEETALSVRILSPVSFSWWQGKKYYDSDVWCLCRYCWLSSGGGQVREGNSHNPLCCFHHKGQEPPVLCCAAGVPHSTALTGWSQSRFSRSLPDVQWTGQLVLAFLGEKNLCWAFFTRWDVFRDQVRSSQECCRMCTVCKALWGKFVICDIGRYKINWMELKGFSHIEALRPQKNMQPCKCCVFGQSHCSVWNTHTQNRFQGELMKAAVSDSKKCSRLKELYYYLRI